MDQLPQAAAELHRDAIVIDLHADTLELVRLGYDFWREHRSMAVVGHVLGHVDWPRLQRGGVTAQLFGVVIPPWGTRAGAERKIAGQSELLDNLCDSSPDRLLRGATAADVRAAHAAGRVAVGIGVEASYGISGNPRALDALVTAGTRYLGPAHVFDSEAGPSNWRHRRGTFGDAGRALVEELRQRSILVDLAHMAREPFLEVCAAASEPVIVSHTGLSALAPMWRNIDDDQIRAVAETGGVIGVIMTPRYLGRPGVAGVVDHLEHLITVGGEDLPALGSDFDGLVRPPRDLPDAAALPRITAELLRRGHPEKIIRKVLGENVLRVLDEVPPPALSLPNAKARWG